MKPAELLRLAGSLAKAEGGDVEIHWTARSRAVSTAYYAVFHALAELCGSELVGASSSWRAYRHVYRSLDHGQARRVLDAERREPGASAATKILGGIFTVLQEARHAADYDPGHRIANTDLANLLSVAERAISSLAELSTSERKLLAARLIGRARG